MKTRVYISCDMASRALGSAAVAEAFHAAGCDVVRTGSRGLFAIEPLVEVETVQGRIGYGPVSAQDVAAVLDGTHPHKLGDVTQLHFFAAQQRISFARCGVIDPLSLEDYRAHGGWQALEKARAMDGAAIISEMEAAQLRGRGGAAFPAAIKWRTVAAQVAAQKYIVCNADEGDSGSFADRMLMEGDPFLLLEGMAMAAHAVGADQAYIYVRSEYPCAIKILEQAIAKAATLIHPLVVHLRVGAGAYVCGEESALLESLEGKRGMVRAKPPVPAIAGLWGQPTLVHNVLSLAAVPDILRMGADKYAAHGVAQGRGVVALQLAGNVRWGGLCEVPYGISLRRVVEEIGGGTASGRPLRAVQVGGPLGAYIPAHALDVPVDYEALAEMGALLGHGSITFFDDSVDMAQMARFAFDFCAVESCGKCTPCRIGAVRGRELIDHLMAQPPTQRAAPVALVEELCATMRGGSLCALGGFTPYPVMSALRYFPEDFGLTSQQAAAE